MRKTSAIDLLRTFSKEEISDFENFISSGYHNKNTIVVSLYNTIKKYAPAFDDNGLEKETVWERIYPGKRYNYGIMKNLIFELKKLSEDYLSYCHWKNSSTFDKSLIQALWDKNAMDIFLKKANSLNEKIEKSKAKDQLYYTEKLFVQPLIDEYNMNRIMYNESRSRTNDLLVESFILQYLLNCFHLAIEMHKTNNKHDLDFLEYLLNYFKDNERAFENSPLIKVLLYLMISFFDINEDKYYSLARNLFNSINNTLPVNEIKNVYNVLMVLCLFKINAGKKEYRKVQLELNLEMFNRKILSHRKDGTIELEAYRNIVKLAANANEYLLLKDFINENKNKVISNNPETVILYSDATLRFAEGRFDECLKLCSKINFKDFWEKNTVNFFFKCDVKMLQLKSYYEQDHIETLINTIDSFKHLLKNASEINEMNKKNVREFLGLFDNFINSKINTKIDQIENIKREVLADETLSAREWFLKKIDESL